MKKREKIYLAGCGGMLGEAFFSVFNDVYDLKCTDIDLNETWLDYLDFRNFQDYRNDVIKFAPDYLFHLGAHTDLEYCELNQDDAYLTNTIAVENAVYIANELNIPILYISTAGIFDGSKQSYDDWDQPNPLGVYARSKYMAERFVVENANKYLICRAGWMMGGGLKKDKKFVNKIMKQIKNGSTELFVVDDKDGTPTYTIDFANTVFELIRNKYWGLYNTVCDGQTSRLEVANEIISILGLTEKVNITPVSSSYFKEQFFAERPISERLITRKLDLRNVNKMRNWKISLREYITNNYID